MLQKHRGAMNSKESRDIGHIKEIRKKKEKNQKQKQK